jgi:hypothetical protein
VQTLGHLSGYNTANQKHACVSNTINCILTEIKQAYRGNLPQMCLLLFQLDNYYF